MQIGQAPVAESHTRYPNEVNVPERGMRKAATVFARAFRLRCPYCGTSGIFRHPFALRENCPGCGTHFEREDGYFLGAFVLNLLVAEFIGVAIIIALMFRTELSLLWLEGIAISVVIVLPLVFFPFSRTCWMALTLVFDQSHRDAQIRGGRVG